MREKAPFRTLLSAAYLSLALLLIFAQTGGSFAAPTQRVRPRLYPLPAAETGILEPPDMPLCHRAPDHVVYLPLIMRGDMGAGLRASGPAETMTIPLNVVLIYDLDPTTVESYHTLLGNSGFDVYPLPLEAVANVDFAGCDQIIIGSDTGTWTGEAARTAVLDAGLPVAAIGDGGLSFLSAAGLLDGLATGSGSGTGVEATLRGRDAYLFPKTVPLAGDDSVQLYSTASAAGWLELPAPLPDGIEIGTLPGTTQVPIVQLQKQFLLWGFGAGPGSMTEAGEALFVNSLAFQGRGVTIPLRSRRFIPKAGVEFAFLHDLAMTPAKGLHAFIQLRSPPGDPACDDLANLVPIGITELYRLYGQTHVAFVTTSFNPKDGLVAACLRWVGRILPQDRTHPAVLAGDYPEWADNGDGTVDLMARFMPDVSASAAEGILDGLGATHELFADERWTIVIAKTSVETLTQEDALRWLSPGPDPGFPTNDVVREALFVDDVQMATVLGGSITYNGLDGTGVTVGVFDKGPDMTHPDLSPRMLTSPGQKDHGTHVAGIIGSSGGLSASVGGTPFQWRGVAPGVEFAGYSMRWSRPEMEDAFNLYNMEVSNHSYVMTCGDYGAHAENADDLVRGDLQLHGNPLDTHLMAWGVANQGRGAQYCELVEDDATTGPRGFYSVLSPAKNVLSVGGIYPTAGYAYQLSAFSSRGPTWDGRLKPDVMGVGCARSTVPDAFIDVKDRDCDGFGDDWCYPYDWMCGTSMASPSVAGVAALMIEQYHDTYSGRPDPEGLKALLINTATDLVQDPAGAGYLAYSWNCPDMGQPVIFYQGPDFTTGYGVVHARRAVEAVAHKDLIVAYLAGGGDMHEYTVDVLADREELRFTLAWSDPAGDPSLDVTTGQLVNDLDLVLEDPNGGLHHPWVLDPLPAAIDHTNGSPDPITQAGILPAYRAEDHRNNVEQVVVWADDVDPADWAGPWTVRVQATGVDSGTMPQPYALAGEWREITLQNIYPLIAGYNLAPDVILIPVQVRNPYASPAGAAGDIPAGDWTVRIGDGASNTWAEATVESAYGPIGDLAYLVVRPPDTLSAGILYDIEVTLQDAYQVDERVSEAYEAIDRATHADAILFLAEPRAPVDEMLVMDNSGSMLGHDKLDSAQNAARAFADRRQAGDMIGLARFWDTASTAYDLTLISAAETQLDAVKLEIDGMTADGLTALGPGLLEGKGQLVASGNPTHTWNIVLLGDGEENVPPCWDTEPANPYCEGQSSMQPEFVPAGGGCPALQVDTVSIGPEVAIWRDKLEDIAEKTCGLAWNAAVEEGDGTAADRASWAEGAGPAGSLSMPLTFPETLPNTLADIYISIADGNSHQQRLWEETGILDRSETIQRTVYLESGLPEATFAVNWPDAAHPIAVRLLRPTGVQVDPADPDAHHKADATHEVYRLDGPVEGDWTLQLAWTSGVEGTEYLAVASGHSDVSMLLELGLLPPEQLPGAVMPIYVVLVDEDGPLTGANVQLAIRRPGGGIDSLTMHDDGSQGDGAAGDGVYTNEYTIPGPGTYQVKARAEGTAHDGEPFLRHRLRHFRVASDPRAAYVLSKDGATANAYKALLDGNGLEVTLVDLAGVETTDLSPFELIIIGPDTGAWDDPAKVNHVDDAGKPVLGLGDGGYALFGGLGLSIGNLGASASDAEVVAEDPAHDVWHEAYDLELGSPDPSLSVYGKIPSPGVAVYLAGTDPKIVEKLAQRPSSNERYWLAREQSRYLLWGFDLGPLSMTGPGEALFVNTAYYALR